MSATDERTARLPQWAQSELRVLRAQVATLNATLAQGPEDSDTTADPHADLRGLAARPLGTGTPVRFELGRPSDWVDVRTTGRAEVEIMASSRVLLRLQASNVLFVSVRS